MTRRNTPPSTPHPVAPAGDDLGPPWIIFADQGKSVAILPAGRPGEVADVRALPDEAVRAIVNAANSGERGAYARLGNLTERVLAARNDAASLESLRAENAQMMQQQEDDIDSIHALQDELSAANAEVEQLKARLVTIEMQADQWWNHGDEVDALYAGKLYAVLRGDGVQAPPGSESQKKGDAQR